ncbi:MAG: hypothetical protein KDD21_08270, partial [Bacteroidetes bacterium]|nr:hypothetical protein [Bacteroidota bacterium]
LYSKLLNDTTVVTEDCLNDDANSKINQLNKLFFYALYPNTIALPKNYIDLLEEYSTVDEFFGPYYVLNTAYFLKKYNIQNLSKAQKEKLNSLVNQLCNTIYTKYVKNNNLWNFYKFSALKVLLMNEYEPAQKTDISQVITYINAGGPLKLSDEDRNDVELMNRAGGDYVFRHSLNASMWIFLLELNKN